jgi:hypothetical protein
MLERVFKGGLLAESDFDSYLNSIRAAQEDVDRCIALVDRHGRYCQLTPLPEADLRILRPSPQPPGIETFTGTGRGSPEKNGRRLENPRRPS